MVLIFCSMSAEEHLMFYGKLKGNFKGAELREDVDT